MLSDFKNTEKNITFNDIIGRYSFESSIYGYNSGIIDFIKLAPNGIQGFNPYIYGYYREPTSTLTGIWSSVTNPDVYPKNSCLSGEFIFHFFINGGKIAFNGTWGCGNKNSGGYNSADYWNGIKF